ITAERVTSVDELFLDLDDYDFLAVVTNRTFNGDGLMFEYTQSRHRPDCFSFSTVALRNV
ncbi:MAG: UTRA domain-containing protein, partial [Olsenella sp.]